VLDFGFHPRSLPKFRRLFQVQSFLSKLLARLRIVSVLGQFCFLISLQAQGLSPQEAAKRMTLPEGFEVNVFASEPEIRQPVASCWDHKGRLWVIEYLQYPVPEGLKPLTVDVYLRTEYDRIPEPPPRGPRGKDRIKILEDTDGDGKADKVTTFLEGLNLASAIAVGYDGVFVGQAPYLLHYSDKNHDDKPDGDPEVLLKGFGLQDAHAVVNSLAWGPDGWLYGAQGSTVTARIQGVEFQQGIWRYHFPTKRFELFAEGGGNTWGLDFDKSGQAFGSSNGGFITFHMTQGGNYWKGFSKHGPLHNPYSYGYFDCIPYDGSKKGGHVTPGGIFYRGAAFPSEFQDAFIGGNLLSNTVYWHKIKPVGSTYGGSFGGTLIQANDPWFRPIDLLTGPDDAVYVVDWYDKRASHLDPRDNWDKSNGRIYRIAPKGTKPAVKYDLTKESVEQLVARLDQPHPFFARQALEELLFRNDSKIATSLAESLFFETDRNQESKLNRLWALGAMGLHDKTLIMELLKHPSAPIREWTIRFLGNDNLLTRALADKLEDLASDEKSPAVRLQLAASCRRWPTGMMLPILDKLTAHDEDAKDGFIPLTIWWTVQHHFLELPEVMMEWLGGSSVRNRPLVRDTLMPRLARMMTAQANTESWLRLNQLYELGTISEQAVIAKEIEQGASLPASKQLPEAWKKRLGEASESAGTDTPMFRAALKFGQDKAVLRATGLVLNPATPIATRRGLLGGVTASKSENTGTVLEKLLHDPQTPVALTGDVLTALAGVRNDAIAELLLQKYPDWSADLQQKVVATLATRPAWALSLLKAIESGKVQKTQLSSAQAQGIDRLGDKALSARLEQIWGRPLRPTSESRVRRIAEIRGVLPEGDKGAALRGKEVFKKNCATCHQLFGDGMALGPELNGADRGNLDFLLTSIVDPSSQVRGEYQSVQVALKDGRVLHGLLADRSDSVVSVIDAARQITKVPKGEVEEMKVSEVSLMPEGILDKLSDTEIRDLFRYLQSPSPPLP